MDAAESELERAVDQETRERKLSALISAIAVATSTARYDLELGDDAERLERAVKEIKDSANEALAIIRGRA